MSRSVLLLPILLLVLAAVALVPTIGAAPAAPPQVALPTPTPAVIEPAAIEAEAELLCRIKAERAAPNERLQPLSNIACTGGMAGGFPCREVDLLSLVPSAELNPDDWWGASLNGNDIWGWYHPQTGAEYALVGLRKGVAFVNVTTPTLPIVEAFHPAAVNDQSREIWRDVRAYDNHAFIVSEMTGHGMQVVDMRQLPAITEVARYTGFGSAHSIAINEVSGYAYVVGARDFSDPQWNCNGGLHIVDIRDPRHPTFAGCFGDDGYTHDLQCVVYPPETPYAGREICFAYNVDTLTVLDVSDKSNIDMLARVSYENVGYTHQGWLTEDYQYLLMDDELDEYPATSGGGGLNTRTFVWDVSDLSNPRHIDTFVRDSKVIDHDQYIRGDFAFQSNYRAGLRIMDVADIANIREVGYFDIFPEDDNPSFNGAWGSYVYLPSGNILVNGIEQGLFVLRPRNGAVRPDFDVEPAAARARVCQGQSASLPFHTRALYGYQGSIALTLKGAPAGLTATLSSPSVQVGQTVSLTLQATETLTGSSYLTLEGSDSSETRQQTFALDVRTAPASAPALVSPAPEAHVDNLVTFVWQATPGATGYRLQVSTDPNFETSEIDIMVESTTTTQWVLGEAWNPPYYWRVIPQNECGSGPESQQGSFTLDLNSGITYELWLPVAVR